MTHLKQLFIILLILSLFRESVSLSWNELRNFTHDQEKESKNEYWMNLGREEIVRSLEMTENKRAKNVILFLGDGMGVSTITASRILKGQLKNQSGEEGYLFFERNLPNTALIKTYNIDRMVPDSAGTGTCYLSGVKSNYEVIGVNAVVKSSEEDCKVIQNNKVISIMEQARKAGKAIGVVTTTRITHATPAASYAHAAHRDHESYLPEATRKGGCKDIATQLIEEEPGISFNVILGGGRSHFLPNRSKEQSSGDYQGMRDDNVDLIEKWKNKKAQVFTGESGKKKYQYIETVDELNSLDPKEIEHVFGLFNWDHITYNHSLPKTDRKEPTLKEMSDMAIKILSKYEKGFLLLVEGGRIDLASHANKGFQALHEAVHFDETIESGMSLINQDETLVMVTADHSHTLIINGYPYRGTNIFGFSDRFEMDNQNKITNKRFTILSYGNGPGHIYGQNRTDPATQKNLGEETYVNYAGVRLDDSSHGGEDVVLFSNKWPNLVRGVKEQNLVAHIITYVSCIGQYTDEAHCTEYPKAEASTAETSSKTWIYVAVVAVIVFALIAYIAKRKNYI